MKYLKNKKRLFAYSGTDAEALAVLNAVREVLNVDLLPFLNGTSSDFDPNGVFRSFDENPADILPEIGTNNRQTLIDSGALPLLQKIQVSDGSGNLLNYVYTLKDWYSNKITKGKIIYERATPSSPYKYFYVENKVFTPAQKAVLFQKEFDLAFDNLGGVPANKTAESIKIWETYLTNPAENSRMKQLDTIFYKGFWSEFFEFYKNKRLMAASVGSRTGGGAGSGAGVGSGSGATVDIDPSGGGAGATDTFIEGDMTETEALQFLYEIEKFSPINWGNLDYWYKELMAKKKEVSKEVFNFAYDFWLKKLNKQYETFSPMEKEKEKDKHALINGYVYEKPKKVKKYGLFATIIRAIFKKK